MSENQIDTGDTLSLSVIFEFIRKYWFKTVIRAAVAFILTVLVFACLYVVMPAKGYFSNPITISLPCNKKMQIIYPNDRVFNSNDVISRLVLNRVYDDNQLKGRISFEKFVRSFHIADFDTKRAKIDAEYRAKLSTKNLRVSDIQTLESQYKEKLAKIRSGAFHIGMTPLPGFTTVENVKILNSVPRTWFEIYSKLDAKPLPQMPSVSFVRGLNNSDSGTLIALEKARICMRSISAVIRALNTHIPDRQLRLSSGESLGDLKTEIDNIAAFQLAILRSYTLGTPELRGKFDRFFIQGQLDAVEHNLARLRNKQESIEKALNIVSPRKAGTTHTAGGKTASGENSVLQLDSNFLPYFAELIRNDHTNTLRLDIASQLLTLKDEIAYYETEKAYFSQLLKLYSEPGIQPASAKEKISLQEIKKMLNSFTGNLAAVTGKLYKLRDMISAEYLTESYFYIQTGRVQYHKDMLVKPVKLILFLVALWGIFNFVAVIIDFNKFVSPQKK